MNWSALLQISGNPAVSVTSPEIDVEAIDRVEAAIEAGDTNKIVNVQPGALAEVHVLLVKATPYAKELSFKINDGAANSPAITLDSPQLFAAGGLAAIGIAPKVLKFSNSGANPATVEVFVVRNATPREEDRPLN